MTVPREFDRTRRIGEQLQRELAGLIREEIRDPRIGMVTVVDARVSRDLSHARIYVTLLSGDVEARRTSVEILNRSAGVLRGLLGRRLRLRTVPKLRFEYDTSVERGAELSALIDAAVASDRKLHQ